MNLTILKESWRSKGAPISLAAHGSQSAIGQQQDKNSPQGQSVGLDKQSPSYSEPFITLALVHHRENSRGGFNNNTSHQIIREGLGTIEGKGGDNRRGPNIQRVNLHSVSTQQC